MAGLEESKAKEYFCAEDHLKYLDLPQDVISVPDAALMEDVASAPNGTRVAALASIPIGTPITNGAPVTNVTLSNLK